MFNRKKILLVSFFFLTSCNAGQPMVTDEVIKADKELKDGAPQAALELLRGHLAEHPNNAETLTELGKVNAALGRNEAAALYFQQALKIKPQSLGANKGLAKLELQKNPAEAQKILLSLTQSYPRDAQSLVDLGVSYDLMGHYAQAQESYKRAMYIDPMLISAQSNLALSYAFSGYYDKALELIAPLATAPDTSTLKIRNNFALVQYLAGYTSEAQRTLMQDMDAHQAVLVLNGFSKFKNQPMQNK